MKQLTAEQLAQLMNEQQAPTIIDVREDYEVQYGVVPGALHIRLGDLEYRISELDERKTYALICKAGVRSEMAAQYMESVGFDVINITDGMYGWTGERVLPDK